MSFDPTAPYGTVSGIPGVSWAQDGKLFNGQGLEVTYRRERAMDEGKEVELTIVEVVEAIPAASEATDDRVPFMPPLARRTEAPAAGREAELRGMHWKHLEAMLSMVGEEYRDKEQAIEVLMRKSPVA